MYPFGDTCVGIDVVVLCLSAEVQHTTEMPPEKDISSSAINEAQREG